MQEEIEHLRRESQEKDLQLAQEKQHAQTLSEKLDGVPAVASGFEQMAAQSQAILQKLEEQGTRSDEDSKQQREESKER